MQTTLVHPFALLAAPSLAAAPIGLASAGDVFEVVAAIQGFLHVRQANGHEGFVPAAACGSYAFPAGDTPRETFVTQPVVLYAWPAPGGQYAATGANDYDWMVMPDEVLGVLGKSEQFALVQRPSGQVGYIPLMLSRETLVAGASRGEKIVAFIAWAVVGFSWLLLVWSGLYGWFEALSFIPRAARPFIGLALAFGSLAAFWLSRKRELGRPFAVGVALAYGLMHLVSQGWATFWRS